MPFSFFSVPIEPFSRGYRAAQRLLPRKGEEKKKRQAVGPEVHSLFEAYRTLARSIFFSPLGALAAIYDELWPAAVDAFGEDPGGGESSGGAESSGGGEPAPAPAG